MNSLSIITVRDTRLDMRHTAYSEEVTTVLVGQVLRNALFKNKTFVNRLVESNSAT